MKSAIKSIIALRLNILRQLNNIKIIKTFLISIGIYLETLKCHFQLTILFVSNYQVYHVKQ
jgi:hypothetical protein